MKSNIVYCCFCGDSMEGVREDVSVRKYTRTHRRLIMNVVIGTQICYQDEGKVKVYS